MAKAESNLNIEIYLEDVRLSYPHLFEPTQFKRKGKADTSSKPRFTASFLLDKKKHKKTIEEIEDAIDDVIEAKWGKKPPKFEEKNICLSDGDESDKDEQAGCMVLKAAAPEKSPPKIFLRDMSPAEERDGKPYGGCYVNALVRIYAYDEWSDQVNASLEIVQYYRKGEPFGKGAADTSKFKSYGEDDDEGDYVSARGRSRDRDEEDAPRSRRGRDEDEAPRSRRGRDEEDAPRRSRSRDDDEDAPRSRRGRDEEEAPRSRRERFEEDEAPRSRRGRDDDEDAPRSRRSRSRDDDDIPF